MNTFPRCTGEIAIHLVTSQSLHPACLLQMVKCRDFIIQDKEPKKNTHNMNTTNILSLTSDQLSVVCSHIKTVHALARLSETCKTMRNYIASRSGRKHWMDIARHVCGDAYVRNGIQEGHPTPYDERYAAMLMICPWISKQARISGFSGFDSADGREWDISDITGLYSRTHEVSPGVISDVLIARVEMSIGDERKHEYFQLNPPGGDDMKLICPSDRIMIGSNAVGLEAENVDVAKFDSGIPEHTIDFVEKAQIEAALKQKGIMPKYGGVEETADMLHIHQSVFAVSIKNDGDFHIVFFSKPEMKVLRCILLPNRAHAFHLYLSGAGAMWTYYKHPTPDATVFKARWASYYGPRYDKAIVLQANRYNCDQKQNSWLQQLHHSSRMENNIPIWLILNGKATEAAEYVMEAFGTLGYIFEHGMNRKTLLGFTIDHYDIEGCRQLLDFWGKIQPKEPYPINGDVSRAIDVAAFDIAMLLHSHYKSFVKHSDDQSADQTRIYLFGNTNILHQIELDQNNDACGKSTKMAMAVALGFPVDCVDSSDGTTALIRAAKNGSAYFVSLLIRLGANKLATDSEQRIAFQYYAEQRKVRPSPDILLLLSLPHNDM